LLPYSKEADMRTVLAFVIGSSILGAAYATAQEIEPGDRVIVAWEGERGNRIPLMSRDQTVGWAYFGDVYEVALVRDGWLWIAERQGYLRRADVLPLNQAMEAVSERLHRNPTSNNYALRGVLWQAQGELDRAFADYEQAIRLNPRNAAAFTNRGNAWMVRGEIDRAVRDYDEAIRLDSRNPTPLIGRGIAWQERGEFERALRDYDAALRLDPNDVFALNQRAWLRATSPDERFRNGQAALADATRAAELTGHRSAAELDTLAAAYAEAGDFENAVQWQRRAIELASDEDQEEFQERLALYEQGQPYREER
jgi:tetratricopeptide (TPR) repeat protein